MKKYLSHLALALSLISNQAFANAPITFSGEHLLDYCESLLVMFEHPVKPSQNSLIKAGRCMGFIETFSDTHIFVSLMKHKDEIEAGTMKADDATLFKRDKSLSHEDEAKYIVNYLRRLKLNNDPMLNQPASLVILLALQKEYPNIS